MNFKYLTVCSAEEGGNTGLEGCAEKFIVTEFCFVLKTVCKLIYKNLNPPV